MNKLALIKYLNLPARSQRVLVENGIVLVGHLIKKTSIDLLRMPGLGIISLHEIQNALAAKGLCLNGVYSCRRLVSILPCEHCNKDYRQGNANQLYCSNACQERAYRKRKKSNAPKLGTK